MEHHKHQTATAIATWQDYLPLIIILAYCFLMALVHSQSFMYGFMGYFLVILSMFKLFDLKGFVEGFSSYDLITKKFPQYGYAYPLIELILGLSYLGNILPRLTNILTIIVMSVAAAGVIKALLAKQKFSCACLGTVLKVPLSTVSVIENVGMAVMALVMLLIH